MTDLPDGVQLWLVRHGETEWSVSGKHTSVTDLALTDRGERQATALRARFDRLNPALVLTSPRRRARHTAELAGLGRAEVDPDLAEWNYGEYEGRTSSDIRTDVPGWTLFTDGVPGGESAAEVGVRADRILSRVRDALSRGSVVLVGHGHFSRVLAARWLGLPVTAAANLLLGAAAVSLLSTQYGAPVLENWNLPNPETEDDL
jgi:probable phosphoglycerate mutase